MPEPTAINAGKAAPVTWGIKDTTDGTWLGDHEGPKLFTDYVKPDGTHVDGYALARVAAQVAETQAYGTDLGCKFKAEEFPLEAHLRFKSDVAVKMDPLAALRRLEGDDGSNDD